jgi:AcrR family transcriptional regulator
MPPTRPAPRPRGPRTTTSKKTATSKETAKRAKTATRVTPRKRPGATPRQRQRLDVDERRAQLLALGLEHFGSRAYDDVSIDVIATSAGISKGLLYHYFPTKRAFYKATVREAASMLLLRTETASETPLDLPPLERLSRGLDAYLDYVRAHGRAYAALMRSGVGVDPEIARIVDETRAAFVSRLTDGFTEGVVPSPLVRIALRGWVGLAETASVAWAEALTSDPASAHAREMEMETVRDMLAGALTSLATFAIHAANAAKTRGR